MVGHEKGEGRKRKEGKDMEGRDAQENRRRGLRIRTNSTPPARGIMAAKPQTSRGRSWDGIGSDAVDHTKPPRLVTSVKSLTKSFGAVSRNSYKTRIHEKPQPRPPVGSRAPSIPLAWKPTPTRTSILREAAAKLTKGEKQKVSSVNSSKTKSSPRTSFSHPKASSRRPALPTPGKDELPNIDVIIEDEQPNSSLLYQHQIRNHSPYSLDFLACPRYQNITYNYRELRASAKAADPISALRPVHKSTIEDSKPGSESSTGTSIHHPYRKSNALPSPETKHGERIPSFLHARLGNSPVQRVDIFPVATSPTCTCRQYISRDLAFPRTLSRDAREKQNFFSGQLPTSGLTKMHNSDPEFAVVELDEAYEQDPPEVCNPCGRINPMYGVLPRVTSTVQMEPVPQSPSCRKSFRPVSPQSKNSAENPPGSCKSLDEDRGASKGSVAKSISDTSRCDFPGQDECETQESMKFVKWDPAVIAVGPRIFPYTSYTTINPKREPPWPSAQSEEDLLKSLDDSLFNFTQSLAKLKKSNPGMIHQILAALRELKSDDEYDELSTNIMHETDRGAWGSNNIASDDTLKINKTGMKVEEAMFPNKPSASASHLNLAGERVDSVIEEMGSLDLAVKLDDFDCNNLGTAKSVKRWSRESSGVLSRKSTDVIDESAASEKDSKGLVSHSIAPDSLNQRPTIVVASSDVIDQVANISTSIPHPNKPSPPVWNSRRDKRKNSNQLSEPSNLSKLNPLAPAFRDLSSMKARGEHRRRHGWFNSSYQHGQMEASKMYHKKMVNNITPAQIPNFKNQMPEGGAQNCSFNLAPKPKEPIWINSNHEFVIDVHGWNPDNVVSIATHPHIFQAPPSYIPLVPFPNTLPQVSCQTPLFSAVSCVDDAIAGSAYPSIPSEDDHGRVANILPKVLAEKRLSAFQTRYPLTGLPGRPPVIAPAGLVEASQNPTVAPNYDQIIETPTLTPLILPLPPHVENPAQLKLLSRKPRGHPQQLAKKQRASQIQEALEIKILQYKEKRAAERKELQKAAIESVCKHVPLTPLKKGQELSHETREVRKYSLTITPASLRASVCAAEPPREKIKSKLDPIMRLNHASPSDPLEADSSDPRDFLEYLSIEESPFSHSQLLARTRGFNQKLPSTSPPPLQIPSNTANITESNKNQCHSHVFEDMVPEDAIDQDLRSAVGSPQSALSVVSEEGLSGQNMHYVNLSEGNSNQEDLVQYCDRIQGSWRTDMDSPVSRIRAKSLLNAPRIMLELPQELRHIVGDCTKSQIEEELKNISQICEKDPAISQRKPPSTEDRGNRALSLEEVNPIPSTSRTGSDHSFRASEYIWNSLNLDFKLEALQDIRSKALQSSDSLSQPLEALSETPQKERKESSLSKTQGPFQ